MAEGRESCAVEGTETGSAPRCVRHDRIRHGHSRSDGLEGDAASGAEAGVGDR